MLLGLINVITEGANLKEPFTGDWLHQQSPVIDQAPSETDQNEMGGRGTVMWRGRSCSFVMMERGRGLTGAGAYIEIVIRGGPGVEVEVNLLNAKGVSRYRPRGVWGHALPGKFFEISITNGAL